MIQIKTISVLFDQFSQIITKSRLAKLVDRKVEVSAKSGIHESQPFGPDPRTEPDQDQKNF